MFEDLDPKLNSALEALRREFDTKLDRQRAEFQHLLGAPAEEPAAAEAAAVKYETSDLDPLAELKLAATEIDRAESQADVLDALIRASRRFASRSALFLHRAGSLEGWGGNGFGVEDSTITGLLLDASQDSPWRLVTQGTGGVTLTATDCALLSDRLGAEEAEVGVLVPFILQDQVAAVLYADRLGSPDVFNVSGLQLLSFIAGQTVETLPVRERHETAALRLAASAVEPAAEPVAPPVVPEPSPEPRPEPAVREIELEEVPVEPSEPSTETPPPAPEPEITDLTPEPEPAPEVALQEPRIETAPEPEPDAAPSPVGETRSAMDESPAIPDQPPVLVTDEEETGTAAPEAPFSPTVSTEPPAPFDTVAGEVVTPIEPPPVDEPSPAASGPEPPIDPASMGTTEVKPPTDVDGPGWAFTTTKIPTSSGAEAQHEEARRLARLLVTEIKLYNEEIVEEGRSAGDVYTRLQEDIERSRQIFEDRIAPDVRNEKDFFHEALVRILAGGDASALGM